MKLNFLRDLKLSRVSVSAVAAQTVLNSSVLDMQGYDSVLFFAALGDVTTGSVLGLTAYGNDANATGGTAVALKGNATYTAGASDADSKLLAVDVQKPRQRYVYAALSRTTANAVVDGIFAVQYNSNEKPISDTDLAALFISYAESNDPDAA